MKERSQDAMLAVLVMVLFAGLAAGLWFGVLKREPEPDPVEDAMHLGVHAYEPTDGQSRFRDIVIGDYVPPDKLEFTTTSDATAGCEMIRFEHSTSRLVLTPACPFYGNVYTSVWIDGAQVWP